MGIRSLWEWEETTFLPTRVGYKAAVYDPVDFLRLQRFRGPAAPRHRRFAPVLPEDVCRAATLDTPPTLHRVHAQTIQNTPTQLRQAKYSPPPGSLPTTQALPTASSPPRHPSYRPSPSAEKIGRAWPLHRA